MYPYLQRSQHLPSHSGGSVKAYFLPDQAVDTLFPPDSVQLSLRIPNAAKKDFPQSPKIGDGKRNMWPSADRYPPATPN